ncbi:MAG: hypothetical protein WC205_13730 [Opitutaceae bacterium]
MQRWLRRWLGIAPASVLTFNDRAARRKLRRASARICFAHVVVYDEVQCGRALDLLRVSGWPAYIVHFMDILESKPLTPDSHPQLFALCREAKLLVGISRLLLEEIGKHFERPTYLLPVCADPATLHRVLALPVVTAPFRIAIFGTLYPDNCTGPNHMLPLLEAAWPRLLQQFPRLELHYAGASFDRFPQSLRPQIVNHGLVSPAKCLDLLASCTIAILTSTYPKDSAFRFSVPSRISDYFALGLPVLAWSDPQTAQEEFLQPLIGHCVTPVRSIADLVSAIATFHDQPEIRARQSAFAREFARTHLDASRHAADLERRVMNILTASSQSL